MEMSRQLEKYCQDLEGNLSTKRKKACEELLEIINNKGTLDCLREGAEVSWNKLMLRIQTCLLKDGEKRMDDLRKKGNSNYILPSADLFSTFVRIAIREDGLEVKKITGYIMKSLRNEVLKKCFEQVFLKILTDCILTNSNVRSHLSKENWEELFMYLKSTKLTSENDFTPIKCLSLVIKWGPLYTCPVNVLREQFTFITKICQSVSLNSSRPQKEAVVEIVYNFCLHVSKDNRMSCCKLGEVVLTNLLELYEINVREEKLKVLLVNFFLLQMAIHHPKGATKEESLSYAHSPTDWKNCLRSFYYLLNREIEINIESQTKNQAFFVTRNGTKELMSNFLQLFVEVFRQLFVGSVIYLDVASPKSNGEGSSGKRQRVEPGVERLLDRIQETKSWAWISITYSVLEKYPTVISSEYYSKLLLILSDLQVECKDLDLSHHLHRALFVLHAIQDTMTDLQLDLQKVWDVVGKSTLRSIGLNPSDEASQMLLQSLIKCNVITSDLLVQNYRSGILHVEEHSLETLDLLLQHCSLTESDKDLRIDLMKWILNSNHLKSSNKCFTGDKLPKILISLSLKQWVCSPKLCRKNPKKCFEDIENIYSLTVFDSLITNSTSGNGCEEKLSYCVDSRLFNALIELLTNFANSSNETGEDAITTRLTVSILLFTTTSYIVEYDLIDDETSAQVLQLFEVFKSLFLNTCVAIVEVLQNNHERHLAKIIGYFQLLNELFNKHIVTRLCKELMEIVSEDLIRSMFLILQAEKSDSTSCFEELMKTVMRTLTSFCFVLGTGDLTKFQEKALECILNVNSYEAAKNLDYELILTLLHSVVRCNPRVISDNYLLMIFNMINSVCEVRYSCCLSAHQILEVVYELYPLIFCCGSHFSKCQFVGLLFPFYNIRLDCSPAVCLALINCMGLLYRVSAKVLRELDHNNFTDKQVLLDPECVLSRWADEEIVLKIPQFLTDNHQEVRLAAIKSIASFFELSSKGRKLEDFHRQEIMFDKLYDLSIKVFEIEGEIIEERKVDETITRSSSVLHTYTSIMIASNLWVDDALFALLKIVCERRISLDQFNKAIDMVSIHLGFESRIHFLEKYLSSIFAKWRTIEQFPFSILNCQSRIQLYNKYWTLLAPTIIEKNHNSLEEVAALKGTTVVEIVEQECPKLLACCFARNASDLESLPEDSTYKFVAKCLTLNKLKYVLKSEIDQVLLHLLDFVRDATDFGLKFDTTIVFSKTQKIQLTVEEFLDCVRWIESALSDENDLITSLLRTRPRAMHFMLLHFNLLINNSLAVDEKLTYFHLYSIISELFAQSVKEVQTMQEYFFRNLTYNLLHLIKSHTMQPELSFISCKFLKTILTKVLPDLAEAVKTFLLVIANTLKNVALQNSALTDICVEILTYLVVDNSELFKNEIEKLDTFPQSSKFDQIYTVHHHIKYQKKITLEIEIDRFLNFGKQVESLDECEDGLKHLRFLLSSRKIELGGLYEKVGNTRGFSEDCENSCLHQLICMLIKLSSSNNSNVRSEAIRCLGEIGAADLTTLVLQPEKPMADSKWTSWELFSGNAISLLSKYIVDSDVNVAKVASDALLKIMETKEGRKVALSGADFGFGPIRDTSITPFLPSQPQRISTNLSIDGDLFVEKIEKEELWSPTNSKCHKTWITQLLCSLLETFQEVSFFAQLIAVCKLKAEFSEHLLPLIIFNILHMNIAKLSIIIAAQIKQFFSAHWTITVVTNSSKEIIAVNKSSVQCMLNVVNFIRLQRSVKTKRQFEDMSLNYLKIAKAAQFCTAHFTALLYAELWCQEQINNSPRDYCYSTYGGTKLDTIYDKLDETTGKALENILRKGYKAIGEVDAQLGCGTAFLLDPQLRVEHYKELGRWEQVVHHYEVELSHDRNRAMASLTASLKNCNLYQLSLFSSNTVIEPDYECLWRLGQWDDKNINRNSLGSYEKFKFFSLKALHDQDEFSFEKSLEDMRLCIVKDLVDVNLESCKNFYSILAQMRSLREMEEFVQAAKANNIEQLLQNWTVQDDISKNDFQYVEPIKAQRIVLLTEILRNCHNEDLNDSLVNMKLDLAEFSRVEGHCYLTTRILGNLRRSCSTLSNDVRARVQVEEAQMCWAIQDVVTAKCLLKQLCGNENVAPRLHALALRMTGQLMVESCSENRQTIIEDYFLKSLKLLQNTESREDIKSVVDTSDQLAKFADKGYQQVMAHIKSEVFQKKLENMKKAKESMSKAPAQEKRKLLPDEIKRAIMFRERQAALDQAETTNIEKEKDSLLILGLKYYLRTLLHSDDHNINIFRVISLLLENRNSEVLKSVIETEVTKIPSYKFITILPQIIPHITKGTDSFSNMINSIIENCAKDHPYHTLPLLLALVYANEDLKYTGSKQVVNDSRTQAAQYLLKRLKTNETLSGLIAKMETLTEALIQLAYCKPPATSSNKENVPIKIERSCKILKVKQFHDILVPTCHLEIDKSCTYSRITGIHSFSDTYSRVGGVNAPKRITCLGTDGINRDQLVKGQDDLRQDAVMQQVFTIMNSLFIDKQTKNLQIRTYKVVPLSMRSGILEWVQNSMPIGLYLAGDKKTSGAHVQYRPMDKSPVKCRSSFANAGTTPEEKLRTFKEICRNIQPVFHKFFETNFPQPTVWYERRRAYIYSVATSSMCGYMLGIGDRHVSNILIDNSTAEVIHIDFGIAFEQGRVLPTPETVPFRLTRDIVDGMGVSGVEGVFRRSCEKTVEVLRRHQQTIITILEVLLYDPLYDWAVSTAEANKRQRDIHNESDIRNISHIDEGTSHDVNIAAERALLRLRAKLQGTENGNPTTIEHQVGTLIQQALDPSNLCRLYHGWQPYL